MAVNFQPQVWGDKVFSPITNAVQQERQRQHQKGLADARNQLDQQRINNQKTLLDMIQLPQARRQEEEYQQKQTDMNALNLHAARKSVQDESMKDYKKAQADVTGKWYIPNTHWNPVAWLPWQKTEKELRNAISAPTYDPQVDMNVSPHVNQAIRNSVRIDEGTHIEDLMNQGGIK